MANRRIIQTPDAPAAIGTYSQAVCVNERLTCPARSGWTRAP